LHFGFVEDDKIYCPIHYGEFNLETGKAQGGPWGIGDLPVYEARVEGEYVQVKLPVSQDLADGFGGRRTAVGRFLSRSTWPPGL
jgi:hypothetical protein